MLPPPACGHCVHARNGTKTNPETRQQQAQTVHIHTKPRTPRGMATGLTSQSGHLRDEKASSPITISIVTWIPTIVVVEEGCMERAGHSMAICKPNVHTCNRIVEENTANLLTCSSPHTNQHCCCKT